MTNNKLLEQSTELLAMYCNNHEDCTCCNLSPICEILPLNLYEALRRISENKEV